MFSVFYRCRSRSPRRRKSSYRAKPKHQRFILDVLYRTFFIRTCTRSFNISVYLQSSSVCSNVLSGLDVFSEVPVTPCNAKLKRIYYYIMRTFCMLSLLMYSIMYKCRNVNFKLKKKKNYQFHESCVRYSTIANS